MVPEDVRVYVDIFQFALMKRGFDEKNIRGPIPLQTKVSIPIRTAANKNGENMCTNHKVRVPRTVPKWCRRSSDYSS